MDTSLRQIIACCFIWILTVLSAQGGENPPPFMGSYVGMVETQARSKWIQHPQLAARVIGKGKNRYEVQLLPEFYKRANPYLVKMATAEAGADELILEADGWSITFTANGAEGTAPGKDDPIPFKLEKVKTFSPYLGMVPPENATVLFDGTSMSTWYHIKGGEEIPSTWKLLDDGSLEVVTRRGKNAQGGGDLVSRSVFGDCRVHIEFKLPYLPGKGGQNRSNSGIFVQELYEVQILDSYGALGNWDECGALYKVWPPKVNASAPPETWQTYDIEFRAARFNDAGKLLSPPVMTVYHNGIPIHKNAELHEITAFNLDKRSRPHAKQPGPIILQDHGHPVQYRNIWVAPLD